MSVQNYETDILQEHTDSTPILVARLDQWRHSVHVVHQYVQGYSHIHNGISANLEKTLKNIGDLPTFSGVTPSHDANSADSQLANVFRGLQSNVNLLLQRSVATSNGIKSSVLPSLDEVSAEIEKHYKTLRNQGTKGIKEVEKSREHTQKLVEHLGQVTSSYGTRSLSTNEDPLIIHRKVEAAVAEQVARENQQAEAALSVQQSFASLEAHVVQAISHTLTTLATLNEGFDKSESEVNGTITNLFKSLDMNKEWSAFTKSNSDNLVPSTNYQRDPRNVTFVNKTHPSTKPVLQGVLNRKGTVLKSYNQGYYIISPTGYLYQFKSPEPTQDSSPELSLYLPGCQVSKSSKVGQYVFKVVGKDSQKAISTRHKYTFKTNSQRELDAWYSAVARMTGNEGAEDDSGDGDVASPSDTPIQSPIEPPVSQMANSSIDERAAQQPQVAQVNNAQVNSAQAADAQASTVQPTNVQTVPTQTTNAQPQAAHIPHEQPAGASHTEISHSEIPHVSQPVSQQAYVPNLSQTVPQPHGSQTPNVSGSSENDPFKGF